MTTLYMTKGLPGSGKSTWAKETVLAASPGTVVRVNKDCLRYMLNADRQGRHTERRVLQARDALVEMNLHRGISVIVDDTNFAEYHEVALRTIANGAGAAFVIKDFTDVPLHTCIERDLKRDRSVGEKVIKDMWRKHLRPAVQKPVYDETLPDVVLVDIDGTVALMDGRSPFEWYRVGEDKPNSPVIDIVHQQMGVGAGVIFVSGRDASCEALTRDWLSEHISYWTRQMPLFMRPAGDVRDDRIVKEEIYRREVEGRYNVRFVLDDRDKVVDMWRGLGMTCLQVAEGAF